MPKISLFLDFDNTLMATEQYAVPSLIERFNLLYSNQIGRKLDYNEFKQHFHGQARETLCHQLSEYFKINIDYHTLYDSREWRIMQYLQSLPNGIEMAPNLLPTLKWLVSQNIELSLVTNNPVQRAFAAMRYAQNGKGNELAQCFGTRFFEAGDIQKTKPDVYLRALTQTNANLNDSFAVEDSLTGATAAIDAGIKTIAFTGFSDNPIELKEKMIAKGCIDSFHDWSNFPTLLEKHLNPGSHEIIQRRMAENKLTNEYDNNELVQIKKFSVVGQDERGLTAEFSLSRKQREFVFLTRKEDSLSGNIYHEGKNVGTCPKTFVLLTGKIILSYRQVGSPQKVSSLIEAPALIEISPNVIHKVQARSDFTLLECNSIKDIQDDRIKDEV